MLLPKRLNKPERILGEKAGKCMQSEFFRYKGFWGINPDFADFEDMR
jgi:hypothetical protein